MTRFYSCHKTDKNVKSLYGFGRRFLKIRDFCMNFEPYFKAHNLVSVTWSNDQSQHDLSCDGVSSSIS